MHSLSIKHLHISHETVFPPEIGRLTSLETLPHFRVRKDKGCQISELGTLKNLKGRLELHNLENVHDKDEAKREDLISKSRIYELKYMWSEGDREGEESDESVFEGLEPHSNLKRLEIFGFKGKYLPSWTSKMAVRDDLDDGRWTGLKNLVEIRLENCRQLEELPMLGQFPNLKYLYLCNLENVRSIGSSFYNIDNGSSSGVFKRYTSVVFPALEKLELSDMSNLTEWVEVTRFSQSELVVFPCLGYLKISRCKKLVSAPSHFTCLKKLIVDGLDSSLPLENICGAKLSSLTHLNIRGVDELLSNKHSLLELKIVECLLLTELSLDLYMLRSLQKLNIKGCPSLKSILATFPKIHVDESGFTSLHKLNISDCKRLRQIPVQLLESCAPSLKILTLEGLTNLTNFPMVVGWLPKMPHLAYLAIMEVTRFSPKEIGPLSSLEILKISPATHSWDNTTFNEVVDYILKTSSVSLIDLTVHGMKDWECLPEQIQNLPNLRQLALYDFGVEAIPEWVGNLSSLFWLGIFNCQNVRILPSKEATQQTKLNYLHIQNCPLLTKESNNEEDDPQIIDSQRHKINHIPNICLD